MCRVGVRIDAVGAIFDGPHATPRRRDAGEKYFLNIASLDNGRLDLSQSDFVDDDDFKKWTRRVQPQEGDLLFSYETRLGEAALMPSGVAACLGRRMALIRPDRAVVDPRYLLYHWLSPEFKDLIRVNSVHGATVSRIPLNRLGSWTVHLPHLSTQRAIADVLGAFDDKIAVNRAVAERSRALSVAVVSRIAGRCSVAELAESAKKSVNPASLDAPEVTHFSLPAFDVGFAARTIPADIQSAKNKITQPCVLISKLNPRIPRIWPVDVLPEGMSVASTEFVALEPRGASVATLWAALVQPDFCEDLASRVSGTTGSHQRVRPETILSASIRDVRTMSQVDRELVDSLCRRANNIADENQILARARDELLPLLMSGKITVKQAAAHAKEVIR